MSNLLSWVDPLDRAERQAEVSNEIQLPMQRRLVGNRSRERRGAQIRIRRVG
ncbi:hypothetical protein KFU94_23815 [Chloroflexi bacterium TSY]|nr:hypothetical protein [Chloroflexi bacterium TSY]